jgi:hypothetical protein
MQIEKSYGICFEMLGRDLYFCADIGLRHVITEKQFNSISASILVEQHEERCAIPTEINAGQKNHLSANAGQKNHLSANAGKNFWMQ